MRRRAALAGLLGLSGCGFHPLYAPSKGLARGAGAELQAVYVPIIPERAGQLMRQALQERLAGSDSGVPKRYELIASPQISSEQIAIQRDTSTTRVRLNGAGPWTLRKLDIARTVLATGTSRIVDGSDINDQEFFALELEVGAATKRIVDSLADQIVQQVAIYLRRQADTATG